MLGLKTYLKLAYPFNIVNVKMPVQRELLDPVGKISLKTSNNFPTSTLHINSTFIDLFS
jgi:hypothetical protein